MSVDRPSVEAKNHPKMLIPEGRLLCDTIVAEARAGRQHWKLYWPFVPPVLIAESDSRGTFRPDPAGRYTRGLYTSMFVPRMLFVAGSANGRIVPLSPVKGIPSDRGKIHNSVAAALAGEAPMPHDWTPHERAQLRVFYTAALRDLRKLTYRDLPSHLVAGRHTSTLDRDARTGRQLWASLGAWPWSLFGPDGALPPDWSQDKNVVATWREWLGDA